jgi:hypothetical protein
MPDAVHPSHSPSPEPKPTRGQGGLVAILVGIVLGVLVGVFYGRAMWLASGGPERRLAELEEILEQKQETLAAARAEDRAEDAERYARHVATIEAEIAEVNAVMAARAAAGGPSVMAAAAWEIVKFMGTCFCRC